MNFTKSIAVLFLTSFSIFSYGQVQCNASHYIELAGWQKIAFEDGYLNGSPPNPGKNHVKKVLQEKVSGNWIDRAGVRGVLVSFNWAEMGVPGIPSTPGVPGNSWQAGKDLINQYLTEAAATGHQLFVKINHRSYKDVNPLPSYISGNSNMAMQPPTNSGNRYVAKLWKWAVQKEYKSLIDELAFEFDGHANFEGFIFQETALGLGPYVQYDPIDPIDPPNHLEENGYSPIAYRQGLRNLLEHASDKFVNSRVIMYLNYITHDPNEVGGLDNLGYIRGIAQTVINKNLTNVTLAGPDILPDNNGDACNAIDETAYPENLSNGANRCNTFPNQSSGEGLEPNLVDNVYALNQEAAFDDEISWGIAHQFDSYRHSHEGPIPQLPKYWKPLEMLNYADTVLNVDYMFWTYANYDWPMRSITQNGGWGWGYQAIASNQSLGDECP